MQLYIHHIPRTLIAQNYQVLTLTTMHVLHKVYPNNIKLLWFHFSLGIVECLIMFACMYVCMYVQSVYII